MDCWVGENVVQMTEDVIDRVDQALNVVSNDIRCVFEEDPDDLDYQFEINSIWADLGYLSARLNLDLHSLIRALPEAGSGHECAEPCATKEMVQEVMFNRAGGKLRFWVPGESNFERIGDEVEAWLGEQSDEDH